MSVRPLLDENLSERLLPGFSACFPGSVHSRSIGFGGASDPELWDMELALKTVIVSEVLTLRELMPATRK